MRQVGGRGRRVRDPQRQPYRGGSDEGNLRPEGDKITGQYLLLVSCVLGPVVVTGDTVWTKETDPHPHGENIPVGQGDGKEDK